MRGLLLLGVVLLAGCAAGVLTGAGQGGRMEDGRSYGEAYGDNRIKAAAEQALVRDPAVRGLAIDVQVEDGVVYLFGQVADRQTAERAAAICREVEGVRRVVQRLTVR